MLLIIGLVSEERRSGTLRPPKALIPCSTVASSMSPCDLTSAERPWRVSIRVKARVSTTFSIWRRTAATGAPTNGTVVKRPALPIRVLRSIWWMRTNSRKASKIMSESAPGATGGMPCICAKALVAVVTISPKPRMIFCTQMLAFARDV